MPDRKIYAIIDNVANDIVGPLWLMRHDQQAIRQFGEIARAQNNQINAHLDDHDLVALGEIDDEKIGITPNYYIVITGAQYRAATENQKPRDEA